MKKPWSDYRRSFDIDFFVFKVYSGIFGYLNLLWVFKGLGPVQTFFDCFGFCLKFLEVGVILNFINPRLLENCK